MAKIEKSIIINAPAEKIFEYLSDPMNMMEWHPSILSIKDVTGRGESQKWTWEHKLMGIAFTGQAQVVSSITNTQRKVKSTGGIESTRTLNLKRVSGGTQLEYELEINIPTPVIGKVSELLAIQRSTRVVEMALANIKERMEN